VSSEEHAKVQAKQQQREFDQQKNSYASQLLNGQRAKAKADALALANANVRPCLPITMALPVSTPRIAGAASQPIYMVHPSLAALAAFVPAATPAPAATTITSTPAAVTAAPAVAALAPAAMPNYSVTAAGTDVPASAAPPSPYCPSSLSPLSSASHPDVFILSSSQSEIDSSPPDEAAAADERKGESPLALRLPTPSAHFDEIEESPRLVLELSLSPNLDDD